VTCQDQQVATYVGVLLAKGLGQVRYGQRHGEEVESIQGPAGEANEEESPLLGVEATQGRDGVGDRVKRRPQRGCPSPDIFAHGVAGRKSEHE
jgi:hypothetical protein